MSSARKNPDAPSFAFHAQAIGLSAALYKPCCENIPGQASVSLSQTGGETYSVIRDFNWKGLISFDEASAYVTGSIDHGSRNTLSTVTVRNLNVANMVHADLVVARVSSRHDPGSPEGQITFAGSMIRNLTIAGETVDVAFDTRPFTALPTYSEFAKNLDSVGATNPRRSPYSELITASLVSEPIECNAGDCDGYTVNIPEFGTIYIAQVIIKPSYRRVSMLRFELGCPIGGSVEACGGESNGAEYWP
jgi:hypothetical protein